jgi:hypothetical protein
LQSSKTKSWSHYYWGLDITFTSCDVNITILFQLQIKEKKQAHYNKYTSAKSTVVATKKEPLRKEMTIVSPASDDEAVGSTELVVLARAPDPELVRDFWEAVGELTEASEPEVVVGEF